MHKYCARTLSANSVLHITLSSLKTTKKTKSHHQIQQSYWPFFFFKKSSCLQTILFCLTLKIMFFLLAFPLVLIILIYLANPITHLTASSLHKITKKKNHTAKSSNFIGYNQKKKNCTLNTQAYSTPSLYYFTLER